MLTIYLSFPSCPPGDVSDRHNPAIPVIPPRDRGPRKFEEAISVGRLLNGSRFVLDESVIYGDECSSRPPEDIPRLIQNVTCLVVHVDDTTVFVCDDDTVPHIVDDSRPCYGPDVEQPIAEDGDAEAERRHREQYGCVVHVVVGQGPKGTGEFTSERKQRCANEKCDLFAVGRRRSERTAD